MIMIAAARVFLALALSSVGALAATQDATLSKEDKAFWNRFLEGSSIPPSVDCLVKVDISCTASDGDTECKDIVPPSTPSDEACLENVCYTVVIENIGTVCMDITLANLNLNGEITDVLDLVPVDTVCPDETTSFETCGDIDICGGGTYLATIDVEADPPNGNQCQDSSQYNFNVPSIPTPSPVEASPSPVPAPPTPSPVAPAPPTPSPVESSPSPVPAPPTPSPMALEPGSPSPGPVPEAAGPCLVEVEITCVAEDGTECSELSPPDVESEETCLVNVCYTVAISNVGDVCMEITVADLNVNDVSDSLLDAVVVNPLCPPDSTTVESCGDIDICTGGEFSAVINVEADPPNGDMCQAEGEYVFTVSPLVPPPVTAPVAAPPVTAPVAPPPSECTIELSSECVISGGDFDGQDCETPTLGITLCMERPTGATMLFNGGGCEQSDNTQELKFSCTDTNGGPPVNEGEEAYIVVTDIKGLGVTYFSGLVAVGDTYVLNDGGERFEADQFITIYTADQSTVLQMVQYHSSCSSNLELKNRFGASQLVEFINDLQGVVSCFQTISFAIDVALPVTATGSDAVELTSMTAMTSFAGDVDLTDQVAGQVIGPDTPSIVVTLEGTINAAERTTYVIAYDVQGTRVSDGELCTGMDMISFEAGADPNAPGAAPTGSSPTSTSKSKGSPSVGSPTTGGSTSKSSPSVGSPTTGGSGGSPTSTSKSSPSVGSPTTGGSTSKSSPSVGSPTTDGSPTSTSKNTNRNRKL